MSSNEKTCYIVDQLSFMHSNGLYSSVHALGGFLCTMMKNKNELFAAQQQFDIIVKYADSLFEESQYKKAKSYYEQALHMEKISPSLGGKMSLHIKYQIHRCWLGLRDHTNAMNILAQIPNRQRTAKVHIALAKLHKAHGNMKDAILSYKETLKQCPLALDAIIALVELGEPPANFLPLISQATSNLDCLSLFINILSYTNNKDLTGTIQSFDSISRNNMLNGNPRVLCMLAQAYYANSDHKSAIHVFEKLRSSDPYHVEGLDLYALLLYESGQTVELEKLASRLFNITDEHPASWVAMGYDALAHEDTKQAAYFAAKATKIDPESVQALLLKGMAFIQMKPTDMKTAVLHFRECIRLSPRFFKAYKELVDCHLTQRRRREALSVAEDAFDQIGEHANTLTLSASVHACSISTKNKAKLLLDKALKLMPNYDLAIEMKTKLLFDYQKYNDALSFALEHIEMCATSKMHVLVGNCYLETSRYAKAVEHFSIAFRLNENCKEAQEGIRKAEQKNFVQTEGSFEADSEEADGSLAHEIMFTDN